MKDTQSIIIIILCFMIGFLGILFLQENKIRVMQSTAIELDYAFYDNHSGEFTWRRNDD